MKQHLLKNTYAAIVALFIGMMVLPTTAQAQSIAKQALKSSSGEMPITGNKIKTASAKASVSFPLLEAASQTIIRILTRITILSLRRFPEQPN